MNTCLRIELSLGSGQWKPLGSISRKDWVALTIKLPKCLAPGIGITGMDLVVRLIENDKPIDLIRRTRNT